MNVYEKELTDKEYEEKLNEIYGPVQICGMLFESGWVLSFIKETHSPRSKRPEKLFGSKVGKLPSTST